MPKWNPNKILLKNANKSDKQKVLASLARIIYDLALAKDKSKPAPKEPSKSIDLGGVFH